MAGALKKAGYEGPIKVVYGSIHSRMPSIAAVQEGDVVFPVTQIKKEFHVLARLPAERIPELRFGPKGRERPLTLRKDGLCSPAV